MSVAPPTFRRPRPAAARDSAPRIRFRFRRDLLVAGAVAAFVVVVGFEGGGFGTQARGLLGVALWLGVAVAAASARVWTTTRTALVAWLLLAGFAAFTLASLAWAPSAEKAFDDFNRVAVYLAVLTLAAVAAWRTAVGPWADGLGIGIAIVGLIALSSRLFPDVFTGARPLQFATGEQTRLGYPLGYWTALGVLVALGIPLILRAAVECTRPWRRSVAAALLPLLAVTLYLTSSRVGVALAVVGAAAFAFFAPTWRAVGALALAIPASVLAIVVVARSSYLVDGPLGGAAAASEGPTAAALLVLVAVATAAVAAIAPRLLPTLPALPSRFPIIAYAAVAVVVAFVVVLAEPAAKLQAFTETPSGFNQQGVETHLQSVSGNGRWQLWQSAWEQFRTSPFAGDGAGSFEAWWAQHGSLAASARNAHSLFLETAGELGLVGLLLIAAALAVGAVAGIRAWVAGRDHVATAAVAVAYLAFLAAVALDWMWEILVVTAVGIVCLAVLTTRVGVLRATPSRAVRAASAAVAVVVAGALAVPLLRDSRLRASRDAADRGDYVAAKDAALDAVAVQPWAYSPYLQVALLEERAGQLAEADRWIRRAIERDPVEWRLWLTRARIETKRGRVEDARRSLVQLRRLNPHSQLFRGPG